MKKGIGVIFILLLGLWAGSSRYWGLNGGVNSTSFDLVTHFAISEHLKQGELFPELYKTDASTHSVSKYLPVYHGLLGFHVLAMVGELLGMPRPGSYALVLDLSLLATLFAFGCLLSQKIKTGFRWEYLLAALAVIPIYINFFTIAADATFYSQLLSQALLSLAILALTKNHKNWATALVLYAVFTYPDFLLFIIPVFVFKMPLQKHLLFKIPATFLWLVLLYIPLKRAGLPGPYATNLFPYGMVSLIVLLFWKEIFLHHRKLFMVALTLFIIGIILLSYKIENGNPSYYALKLCAFSYLLLPYLLLEIPILDKAKGRVLVLSALFFVPAGAELWSQQMNQFWRAPTAFSNEGYTQATNIKETLLTHSQKCETKNTVVFPIPLETAKGNADTNSFMTGTSNAILLNYDVYNFKFHQRQINAFFHSDYGSFKTVAVHANHISPDDLANNFVHLLLNEPSINDFCLVIPTKYKGFYLKTDLLEEVTERRNFSIIKTQ